MAQTSKRTHSKPRESGSVRPRAGTDVSEVRPSGALLWGGPKRGPDHCLEENGKADQQVIDDLRKPPGVLFSVLSFDQAEQSLRIEEEIKGDGKAPVISLDSHIRRENLAKDCKDHTGGDLAQSRTHTPRGSGQSTPSQPLHRLLWSFSLWQNKYNINAAIFTIFKCTIQRALVTFPMLCNHHHRQLPKLFHRNSVPIKQ